MRIRFNAFAHDEADSIGAEDIGDGLARMQSAVIGMEQYPAGISNIGGRAGVEVGVLEALQLKPEKIFAVHSAAGFNGKVWWSRAMGEFYEEVWVHGQRQVTIAAAALPELIVLVNNHYGWA